MGWAAGAGAGAGAGAWAGAGAGAGTGKVFSRFLVLEPHFEFGESFDRNVLIGLGRVGLGWAGLGLELAGQCSGFEAGIGCGWAGVWAWAWGLGSGAGAGILRLEPAVLSFAAAN